MVKCVLKPPKTVIYVIGRDLSATSPLHALVDYSIYTIQKSHRVSTIENCVENIIRSIPSPLSFQASVLYPMSTAQKLLVNTSADLDRISTRVMDIPLSRKTHFHRNIVDLDPYLACSVDRVAALLGVLTRCEGRRVHDAIENGKRLKES